MSTVLVPLDGSPHAERALPVARSLAAALGAHLVLVRSTFDAHRDEVVAYLQAVADREGLDPATSTLVASNFPADALHDVALDHDDAVLCLASHGRTGVGHALLGSAAEEILRRAAVPVFVVGPHEGPVVFATDAPGARVGLCVDAHTDPDQVVRFAAAWAERFHLAVEVLTVEAEDDRPISRFHPAPAEILDAVVAGLRAHGLTASATVLRELSPARRIARYAVDHHLALLIASKRSGTGPARDLLGSTTMDLVHQSHCPVLLPPAPG